MENKELIKVNSVVQLNEKAQPGWVGCLLQVTEIKTFGVQGFVAIPMKGEAYLRVTWEQMDYIGQAVMVHNEI